VKKDDLPRYFCISYWEKLPDFVNVLLLNLLADSEELALVSTETSLYRLDRAADRIVYTWYRHGEKAFVPL